MQSDSTCVEKLIRKFIFPMCYFVSHFSKITHCAVLKKITQYYTSAVRVTWKYNQYFICAVWGWRTNRKITILLFHIKSSPLHLECHFFDNQNNTSAVGLYLPGRCLKDIPFPFSSVHRCYRQGGISVTNSMRKKLQWFQGIKLTDTQI